MLSTGHDSYDNSPPRNGGPPLVEMLRLKNSLSTLYYKIQQVCIKSFELNQPLMSSTSIFSEYFFKAESSSLSGSKSCVTSTESISTTGLVAKVLKSTVITENWRKSVPLFKTYVPLT